MQGLSGATSRASMDEAVLADMGPRAGQKPAFLDRGDGSSANAMGWPWGRPTGYRSDSRSLSLANLPTEDSAQPALQSTRSEDGRHRWVLPGCNGGSLPQLWDTTTDPVNSRLQSLWVFADRHSKWDSLRALIPALLALWCRVPDQPSGQPVGITLKVAGVHWWFRTRAHAAELTAGYFNAGGRDGYRDIIALCAKYNATFTLTCVEMCDAQHPPEALCGPEGLLRQVPPSPQPGLLTHSPGLSGDSGEVGAQTLEASDLRTAVRPQQGPCPGRHTAAEAASPSRAQSPVGLAAGKGGCSGGRRRDGRRKRAAMLLSPAH